MMTPTEQIARQLQWFTNHGMTRLDLAVQRATGAWLAPHKGLTRDALQRLLPWCRSENAHGSNVYVRPARGDAVPVVFLDDVSLASATTLTNKHPALAIETSPNRCHVWVATDSALDENGRYRVQSVLAGQAATNATLADLGSVSGDHYGRLAGFRNRKPGRNCWVNLRLASDNGHPLSAGALATQPSRTISTQGGGVETTMLAERSAPSQSERDWAHVSSCLERGDDPSTVERELALSAAARRGIDAARYAAHTVSRALARVR